LSQKPTLPAHHKLHLQNHFGFTRVPFCKNLFPFEMFDSRSQRDLFHALMLWTDVKGLGLVTGPSGVGKGLTVRKFVMSLDEARFRTVHLAAVPAPRRSRRVAGFCSREMASRSRAPTAVGRLPFGRPRWPSDDGRAGSVGGGST
jgi:type II secretory pathway predicted ATPase ExeA